MELSIGIPVLGGVLPANYDSNTHIITSTVLNETYTVNYDYGIENLDSVFKNSTMSMVIQFYSYKYICCSHYSSRRYFFFIREVLAK
jgi:hypothetical protein